MERSVECSGFTRGAQVQTISDLKQSADRALFEEHYESALQLYATIVELQPGNLDARLRVGDTLLALGELQKAAVVYTALARHAALAGYPLRALVALKVLSALEPKLGVLLQEVARLYARESPRMGRSVRRTLPLASEFVEADALEHAPKQLPELCNYAQQLGARYQVDALFYPEKLLPIPLLSMLPEQEFASVLEIVRIVRVRPGTWILRQDEPGRSFYVLARGKVEVSAERAGQPVKLAELSEGSIFGEMALLSDAPRTASVCALSDCDLLEFDCSALGTATATLQHLSQALDGFARERLLSNVTLTSALFRPLDAKQRVDLVRRFVSVDCAPDQPIIHEGAVGTGLYVVLRGECIVLRGAQTEPVARLGPSEMFGEIALLRGTPASATVRAGNAGAGLLFLQRDYFQRLVSALPELRSYFERLSDERLTDLRLLASDDEPLPVRSAEQLDDDDVDAIEVEVLL
jgi:CRP-like cAMP-binding protein